MKKLLERKSKEGTFSPKFPAYWVKVAGEYAPILQLSYKKGYRVCFTQYGLRMRCRRTRSR